MAEMRCYYCGSLIDGYSDEHIIPKFLGSRRTVNCYMCQCCNGLFGRTIEAEFARSLNVIRVLYALRNGEGQMPPPERGIPAADGKLYDLWPGGHPTLHRPSVKKTSIGDGVEEVEAVYRSDTEAKKHLAGFKEAAAGDINITRVRFRPSLQIRARVGGEASHRCVAKTMLNTAAHFEPDLLSFPGFRQLAEFVSTGKGPAKEWIAFDLANPLTYFLAAPHLENIAVLNYRTGDEFLSFAFLVLGNFPYLCEVPVAGYVGSGFNFRIVHDPVTGAAQELGGSPCSMGRLSTALERWDKQLQLPFVRERMGYLLRRHTQDSYVNLVADSFARALEELGGDSVLDDNDSGIEALFELVNSRLDQNENLKYQESTESFTMEKGKSVPDEL